jgi:hypothetical protein
MASIPTKEGGEVSKKTESTVLAYLLQKDGKIYYAELVDRGPAHLVFELSASPEHRIAFGPNKFVDSRDFTEQDIRIIVVLSPQSRLLS